MSYVYIQSEPGLWTVGFYGPDGKFVPKSNHKSNEEAADRVILFNGGQVVSSEEPANGNVTLRDYFAAKAMQGELASQAQDKEYSDADELKKLAVFSYHVADAMCKAREVRNA